MAMTPSALTTRKVSRQPNCWPIQVPSGTPVTRATVRPLNMMAMALAAFSSRGPGRWLGAAHREEDPVGQTGQHPGDDQALIAGGLPGQQVAGGEERHQPTSSHLRGSLPVSAVSTGAPMATP